MKILVVDDEKDIQPLFEQRFRREIRNGELNFVFAYSGEEALACFLPILPRRSCVFLRDCLLGKLCLRFRV